MQIDTSPDSQTFDPRIQAITPPGMSFSSIVLTLSTGCIESDPCKLPECAWRGCV